MTTPETQRRYPDSPLLKEIAHELVQLYDHELFHGAVKPEAILFVESTDTKATPEKIESGEAKVFEIKELPPPVAERLGADYMVIFHKLNAAEMDGAKINAHLLECLMRIKPGGGLRQPDVKTFVPLAKTLGPDWKQQRFVRVDVRAGELVTGMPRQARLQFDELRDSMRRMAEATGGEVTISAGGREVTIRPGNVVPLRQPTGTSEES